MIVPGHAPADHRLLVTGLFWLNPLPTAETGHWLLLSEFVPVNTMFAACERSPLSGYRKS